MIAHGDEMGRTQQGNNNAYCQDSELSWVDWENSDLGLVEFTASLARLRKQHATFRRRRFFNGRPVTRGEGEPLPDIVWVNPNGAVMTPEDWDSGFGRSVGVFLNGNGIRGMDSRGSRIVDDSFLLLFNAHDESLDFTMPPEEYAPGWNCVVNTAGMPEVQLVSKAGEVLSVSGKGLVVLQALAEPAIPPVYTASAAAVPAVPPVPVPTADAYQAAPVEQTVLPPAATPESETETPAKPKRKRSTTPRAPRKRKTEDTPE
jgi:glycogen operon protein